MWGVSGLPEASSVQPVEAKAPKVIHYFLCFGWQCWLGDGLTVGGRRTTKWWTGGGQVVGLRQGVDGAPGVARRRRSGGLVAGRHFVGGALVAEK